MGLAKSESGQWRPTARLGKGFPVVVLLAVELTNDSDQSAVVESLKVAALGRVTVREDQLVLLSGSFDGRHMSPDLGRIACSLTAYREKASFTNENLLAGTGKVVIAPHTSNSYRIWLTCRRLMQEILISHPLGTFSDMTYSLAAIDKLDPVVVGAAHVFTAIAEAVVGGRRRRLCSDRVYAVVPDYPPRISRIDEQPRHNAYFLRDSYAAPPREFVRRIVDWSVKSHAETLAYEVAKKTKAVPAGFDPNAISPYCYSGDRDSPLRGGAPEGGAPGRIRGPRERSDLADVLLSIRKEHPALWSVMEEEITRLCTRGGEDLLARKARYVRKELMRPAKRAKMGP